MKRWTRFRLTAIFYLTAFAAIIAAVCAWSLQPERNMLHNTEASGPFKIQKFGDNGWNAPASLGDSQAIELVSMLRQCKVLSFDVAGKPSPGVLPPYVIIDGFVKRPRQTMEKIKVEFLGNANAVRISKGDETQMIETKLLRDKIVDLVDWKWGDQVDRW